MTKTSNKTRGLSVTGATREAVASFLNHMQGRKFSEAEKAILEVRNKKFTEEDYKKGYVNALEGMLLSVRSGDERDFYNKAVFNKESLKKYKQEFKEFMSKPIRSGFDTGYFSAWSDLIKYMNNSK